MYVLDAARMIRSSWRTSPALSDAGQDVGLVTGFLHEFLSFLNLVEQRSEGVVVVFSEYGSNKKEIEPSRFNRFFPRSEKELLENYDTMKQFLFNLFDSMPIHAINSKNLTDFECVRIVQDLHEPGKKLRVFAPFEEFDVLRSLPGREDLELFGDDLIPRVNSFNSDTSFLLENAPLYFALFGGRYTKKTVKVQRKTVLKLVPEVSTQILGLNQFLEICSGLETKTLRDEIGNNREGVMKSYAFYAGYERIRPVHLRNVADYLKTPKKFNETRFTVSLYKLGVLKHLNDDFEAMKFHLRRLSEN
jgi:hypothetical protein